MVDIRKNITVTNFNRRGTKPSWIVVHYTANNGDTAFNNTSYFKSEYRGASANYFVDQYYIWQCVEDTDTAWHVGNDYYYNGARNTNSIGVEMCSYIRQGGKSGVLQDYRIKKETYENTIELVQYLMQKYDIPISRVCRHYDVTGKYCPAPLVYNNDVMTWPKFLERVKDVGLTQKEVETIVNSATAPLKSRIETLEGNVKELKKKYDYISDCPEWSQEAIRYLVSEGAINGVDSSKDKGDDIYVRLSPDMCRLAVMIYRAIWD